MASPTLVTLASTPQLESELAALQRLSDAGLTLAPLRVVPAEVEETFYRTNNLPTQLSALFSGLDLSDPDEDDIEELAPEAQDLLKAHFLLDETIDLFYEGLSSLPSRVRVRRPDSANAQEPGRTATRGRPALIALKNTWVDDWSFESLMKRLEKNHSVALQARPVIISASGLENAPDLSERAAEILGKQVSVLREPDMGITGVRFQGSTSG